MPFVFRKSGFNRIRIRPTDGEIFFRIKLPPTFHSITNSTNIGNKAGDVTSKPTPNRVKDL